MMARDDAFGDVISSGHHYFTFSRHSVFAALAAVSATCLLCACDSNAPVTDATVVAKVNSDAITLGRVKGAMAKASLAEQSQNNIGPEQIVDAMVGQALAVEQARALQLDETPNVRMAIEEANREILARAYYDHVSTQTVLPSRNDIREYYSAHPELFQQRRLYSLKEIALPESAFALVTIKNSPQRQRSLSEVARQLQNQSIDFQINSTIRAPETLPLDMLPKLASIKQGDMISYHGDGVAYIAEVTGLLHDSIKEEAAGPRIQRFLTNQRTKEFLAEEEKRLRAQAKIEIRADLKNLLIMPTSPEQAATLAMETLSPHFPRASSVPATSIEKNTRMVGQPWH